MTIRHLLSKLPFMNPVPFAKVVRRYEEELDENGESIGGTVAVLDCGHQVIIDSYTPVFRCPYCLGICKDQS